MTETPTRLAVRAHLPPPFQDVLDYAYRPAIESVRPEYD